jgi:replication-associated recombination protein RarA
MFKNLFKKIGLYDDPERRLSPEEKFFSNVIGCTDIKKLLFKCVISKEPVNILLTGPPSSSKTIFLLEMLKGLDDAYFMDGAGASAAGMTDHLFNSNTKYLLIDEIDKMKKIDQAALLNVMESGILCETKLNSKIRQKRIKLWIFATSNDVNRLSQPLRSRFMELHLREYLYEDFVEIVRRVLKTKYQMNENVSEKIASAVWNQLKSRDIRDAINIAKLTGSVDDVKWLVKVQMKHAKCPQGM